MKTRKRLPAGTRFVLQNGWKYLPKTYKYAAFDKNGRMLCFGGPTKKIAKQITLDYINEQIRFNKLAYPNG